MADRRFDIVLFGATGFTGQLTAEYLARNAPGQARWALAGRNRAKLEAVRDRLASINPACARLELLTADVTAPHTLTGIAESARVVITTVGPYLTYGEPLVAACAAAGTDYVDLTGEPEFVDTMYLRYHEQAKKSGARLVHACGFDSIPYDLGVYFTVRQLPDDQPIHVDGFIRAGGAPSGGTVASALGAMGRLRQAQAVARARRRAEEKPRDRTVRVVAGKPHRNSVAQAWVLPMPTIDPQIVARSAAVLEQYGPRFTYSHYAAFRRLPVAVGTAAGTALVAAVAQIPQARKLLGKLREPGDGPDPDTRARGWFTARFHGVANGRSVITEVSGDRDPGYEETAKMLSESALCLAFDDLPPTAGQVTTAVAMGDALIERLRKAGISFTVLEKPPAHPPSRPRR
ncbi:MULTISPECIES: saccharopine dehydrogenase NADP-binding domain-containing protein [Thermocrispum]|nr:MULTISPECIES: saccharopine dehydrogenase NADP-binding domain-containing protein [Thermocrispum]